MRIMAIGADHFAFADRVVRELEALRPLLSVAGETLLRLANLDQNRILLGVDDVTFVAGNIIALVLAALPVHAQAAIMASHADLVAILDRGGVLTFEYD